MCVLHFRWEYRNTLRLYILRLDYRVDECKRKHRKHGKCDSPVGKNRYIIYRPQLHDSIDVIGRQTETGGYPVYIKALKDVVRNIIVNKCNDIKAILEEIKTAFSLGAAVVYSMTDYKAIVYTDGCP